MENLQKKNGLSLFQTIIETEKEEEVLDYFPLLDFDKDLRIGFSGTLGSGKTHLIRSYFQKYYPQAVDQVRSPTYTYYNEYTLPNSVYHFDFYRLNEREDLQLIGFWDLWEAKKPIFVEWVERFPFLLDLCEWKVEIDMLCSSRFYRLKKNSAP